MSISSIDRFDDLGHEAKMMVVNGWLYGSCPRWWFGCDGGCGCSFGFVDGDETEDHHADTKKVREQCRG